MVNKVTLKHAREIGYCSKGMRFFASKYKLNWTKFIKEGLDQEELLATKDDMAIRLVEHVRSKNGK